MSGNLRKAKKLLDENDLTCALVSNAQTYTSVVRGIAPLIFCYRNKKIESSFSAADKVVGKGAAFLYVLLGAKEVFAKVISKPALEVLKKGGVCVTYDELVDYIKNRTKDGCCPMEFAVRDIYEASEEVVCILENEIERLKNNVKEI